MSLSEYLAKNYLTADASTTKPSKKRKRKDRERAPAAASSNGVVIADDDDTSFLKGKGEGEDDAEDAPTLVTGQMASGTFRKAKTSGWTTIKAGDENMENQAANDQAAADAIIASTARENNARNGGQDEEQPQVVGGEQGDAEELMRQREEKSKRRRRRKEARTDHDGNLGGEDVEEDEAPKGGLMTAADLSKSSAENRMSKSKSKDTHDQQETIYRDASGRVVSVAAARAEARRAAEEKQVKEKAEAEARQGDVQRKQRDERRQQLQDARLMDVGRKADDEDMNKEMRERVRWDDPMAGLLAERDEKAETKGVGGKGKRKKTYKGPTESNRYGIRPGWRWDGVDRGNGFEADWFRVRNEKKNRDEQEYAWQMDLD